MPCKLLPFDDFCAEAQFGEAYKWAFHNGIIRILYYCILFHQLGEEAFPPPEYIHADTRQVVGLIYSRDIAQMITYYYQIAEKL